ncbi:helix-turn-helix domain-containing GNAT family N-acetyltransferase [Acuticoccus mangrovi]|uniref:MarR family transcriptional regulator n=1 Tax=Acuticoccus mangrovi TaxID=2796142 RepID=A0A934IKU6_9HYPH|nr:helix-turn-helix domain-containing GNAT family N-acetyltransferase [Acuticoccus mangrovi]MBJ3774142.1 MarR family transcriptional regulator [Acuticoccus mangrovi]
MPATDLSTIERIRDASRRLVRELGFMEATLAGADLSPSAVHAVIEIGSGRAANARALAEALRLEKSTISRLLRTLVADGYLTERRDAGDTRVKRLALTDRGHGCLAGITDYAVDQVAAAIAPLSAKEVATIAGGLETYAAALGRPADAAAGAPTATVTQGYRPGIIGTTVELHAEYYARTVGFGLPFETKLAAEMAEFFSRLEGGPNGFWVASIDGRAVGTIAIDGEDLGGGAAHLRWFIMAERLRGRGRGIGKALIDAALRFVDGEGMPLTRLWTFRSLDVARRLYERAGFELVEERPGRQWGAEVMEQEFRRPTPPRPSGR